MITYSINAHPVIALMFSQSGTDVLPWRDEGSDKPRATIEPHRIMVPTRTRTQAAGLKVRCRYHYTTAAHIYYRGTHILPRHTWVGGWLVQMDVRFVDAPLVTSSENDAIWCVITWERLAVSSEFSIHNRQLSMYSWGNGATILMHPIFLFKFS